MAQTKIMAVIPARGNSKGIPRKNLKLLGGKPLVVWAIDALKDSKLVDLVVVSSEDKKIQEIAFKNKVGVIDRPKGLSSDAATATEVVEHAISLFPDYNIVITYLPTSPFISGSDIDKMVEMLIEKKAKAIQAVAEPREQPFHMCQMKEDNSLFNITKCLNRQFMPKYYHLVGVDITSQKSDGGIYGYEVSIEDGIDIDCLLDFELAEIIANKRSKR
jgi:CMP-N-acetylneuraminic acid synthetase